MAKKGPAARVAFRITKDGEVRLRRIGGLSTKKEREKMAKKPRARWRTSPDGTLYIPLKERTTASQKRATKIQRAACSAGAWAALSRGFSVRPKKTCGPRGFGDSRSHRLLALWRHGDMTKFAQEGKKKRRKNPGKPGTVDLVWQPNEGGGKGTTEWAAVEPRSETVLRCGTAKNPQAAKAAAEKIGREFVSNPAKFVREIEKAIQEHEWEHHRPGEVRAPRKPQRKR